MMIGMLAALVLFAQGSPVETPTDGAGSPAAEASKTDAQLKAEAKAKQAASLDKVVCHEESVVGSRFPRKVCQSRRAEGVKRQEDQETVRHMQDMTQIISH